MPPSPGVNYYFRLVRKKKPRVTASLHMYTQRSTYALFPLWPLSLLPIHQFIDTHTQTHTCAHTGHMVVCPSLSVTAANQASPQHTGGQLLGANSNKIRSRYVITAWALISDLHASNCSLHILVFTLGYVTKLAATFLAYHYEINKYCPVMATEKKWQQPH